MGDHIRIENLNPLNGDYPIDVSYLTNRELHLIKEISGVRANELDSAFAAGDNDLVVAFAAVALARAGVKVDGDCLDRLWSGKVGDIALEVGEEEEETDNPPAEAPPSEPATEESGSEKPASSGDSFSKGGDTLASRPSPTGSQV